MTGPAGVDQHCAALFLSASAREKDDNLLFVRERLLRSEADLSSLLELYRRVQAGKRVAADDTNPLIDLLRLSGVVRLSGSRLAVRNRIYARVFDRAWVAQHMPDAELRRQRAAYRRGLLRAATVATAVLALVGALTVRSVREADLTRRLLYDVNLNFAQQRYETADVGPALALLEETRPKPGQPDLRGFEWYYLWRLCHQELRTLGPDLRMHSRWIPPVLSVAFSPDGKRLASSTSGGAVKLWDPATGREIRTLTERRGMVVSSLAFSPDGKLLACGRADRSIDLWDPATGQLRGRLPTWAAGRSPRGELGGHGQGVTSVAFSPDGRWLATGQDDRTARLWDVRTGRQIHVIRADTKRGVWSVAFSPDGKTLATGDDDGTARLWETATGRPIRSLRGHSWYVYSLAFSPDGKTLATAGGDAVIQLWDPKTGQNLRTLRGHTSYIYGVAFSPDGRMLASAAWDNTVRLWRPATGEEIRVLRGHLSYVYCVAFSPDSKTLASGASNGDLKLWDPNREPEGHTLRGFQGMPDVQNSLYPAVDAIFSRDGHCVVTVANRETVGDREKAVGDREKERRWTLVFDAETGRELLTRRWSLDAIPLWFDGGRYAILGVGRTAQLYDLATGHPLAVFRGHNASIFHARLSPDHHRVLTATRNGMMRVWNVSTGLEICPLRGPGELMSAEFSPDGRRIVSTHWDDTARVWDAATGRALLILKIGPTSYQVDRAAFSPDGQRVVAGNSAGVICVWDARSGQELLRLQGHNDQIMGVSYSPDGRRILSGSYDHTAKVWDAITGRELLTLRGSDRVLSAAFSPDGRRIVTVSADRTVKIWEAASEAEAATDVSPISAAPSSAWNRVPSGRRR